MSDMMRQTAPYPDALRELVKGFCYRPGWKAWLGDMTRDHVDPTDDESPELSGGLTLAITTRGYNSYKIDQGQTYAVNHYFAVPPATYVKSDWQRWLFERVLEVERHEAMEFFQIDDQRPYAPNHSPGHDPYIVHDLSTDRERRTSFRGMEK